MLSLCGGALWLVATACERPRTDGDAALLAQGAGDAAPRGLMNVAANGDADSSANFPADSMADPEVVLRSGLDAVRSLAYAGGDDGRAYRSVADTATLQGGAVVGQVVAPLTASGVSTDSMIEPTHDCRPFTETLIPSVDGGVGNAVVWLVGVTRGPAPDAPRRASLSLERCRLEPRVQRVAVGGTLQLSSRDAMSSRLRFVDIGQAPLTRTVVPFSDAGQVVPTSLASQAPGLVEVRDDLHPWVRGYVAVAPHPFVAVTPATGSFRFDGVPSGRYTVVVWQEKLGVRSYAVRVVRGVETRLRVAYEPDVGPTGVR